MKNRVVIKRYNAGHSFTYGRRNWRWTWLVLRPDDSVVFVGDSYATKREAEAAANASGKI